MQIPTISPNLPIVMEVVNATGTAIPAGKAVVLDKFVEVIDSSLATSTRRMWPAVKPIGPGVDARRFLGFAYGEIEPATALSANGPYTGATGVIAVQGGEVTTAVATTGGTPKDAPLYYTTGLDYIGAEHQAGSVLVAYSMEQGDGFKKVMPVVPKVVNN